MTHTVHKFTVPAIGQRFVIETHDEAEPLTTQFQHGQLVFWMRVNLYAPKVRRTFIAVGTGHPCPHPDSGEYVGTAQDPGTGFVWHLFAI